MGGFKGSMLVGQDIGAEPQRGASQRLAASSGHVDAGPNRKCCRRQEHAEGSDSF